MAANLEFSQAPLVGTPTPLVFGEADFVIPSRTVEADITLDGGVTVEAYLLGPVAVQADITLDTTVEVAALVVHTIKIEIALTLDTTVDVSADCVYDNRVTPWLDCRALAAHQPAIEQRPINESAWAISESKRGGKEIPWTPAVIKTPDATEHFESSLAKRTTKTAPWTLAIQKAQASAAAHQKAIFHDDARASRYQVGEDRRVDTTGRLQTGIFKPIHRDAHWQTADHARHVFDLIAGASLKFAGVQASDAPWQMAARAQPGLSHWLPDVPVLPPAFYWDANLVFECPPLTFPALVFGAQACYFAPVSDAPFYILPARFYMTTHTVNAERLPDLAEVPIYEATVSADMGSYCWTLSASGPASLFAQLAPVDGLPVRLRVWLDGIPFVFAVDSLSRTQKFGQTGVTISGRSVTALIGAPYLRATTRGNPEASAMAQQLAIDALQYSGVDLDWGVASGALANGGLADWLVPAGAWSHQGTPLDAVQAIAQAAGGYLQSHRSAAMLLTRHPYGQRAGDNPGAPWSWMTGAADAELAPDAIITEGLERKDGADINAVYVSGTTQGVLGLVKRTGSAGDKLAAMVTDPLIVHVDAARQRGLAILGAAGPKYLIRHELPVLTGAGQPGVLDVGQLVQINAATPWRGRVRAVSAVYKRPTLRQTVTLERHLEIA